MKKIFTSLALVFVSGMLLGQNAELLKTELKNLKKNANLKNATIGFIAIDVNSGQTLASKNADLSMTPASTLKLVTTATALETFGPKHRFTTTIEYDGTIDTVNKVLNGNLYIRGGGDPTLGAPFFAATYGQFMNEWVLAVKKAGINSISGSVIGDATYFSDNTIPGSWIWSDIGNYYGSGPWGLSIYDNTYKLKLKSGPNHGDATEVVGTDPAIPGLVFNNQIKASNVNRDNGYIYGAPYSNYRILQGTIPKNKSQFTIKGSIPEPPLLAAQELTNQLKTSGITVKQPATTIHQMKLNGPLEALPRTKIFTTNSPMLKEIIKRTNMRSVNLYAEHILVHIGIKKGVDNDTESASGIIAQFWSNRGINTSGMFINDGSGLSRKNAITVRTLAQIAKYMTTKSKYKDSFKASLPVAGKSGTLRSVCRNTAGYGRVHAKSGSMSRVKTYTGYVEAKSGKVIAFAVIFNNYKGSNTAVKNKIAHLFDIMAAM